MESSAITRSFAISQPTVPSTALLIAFEKAKTRHLSATYKRLSSQKCTKIVGGWEICLGAVETALDDAHQAYSELFDVRTFQR